MKYSLRSLMIVATLGPALIALIVWNLLPPPAGSPAAMRAFLSEVGGNNSDLKRSFATRNCFVIGSQAERYSALLAKANRNGPAAFPQTPNEIEYEFWWDGQDPAGKGHSFGFVVVGGTPPVILNSGVGYYSQ